MESIQHTKLIRRVKGFPRFFSSARAAKEGGKKKKKNKNRFPNSIGTNSINRWKVGETGFRNFVKLAPLWLFVANFLLLFDIKNRFDSMLRRQTCKACLVVTRFLLPEQKFRDHSLAFGSPPCVVVVVVR